jgi:hypothetical protein
MTHENIVKVINNFLSEDEMKFFRDYEDHILDTMKDHMVIFNNGNRPILQFGKDLYPTYNSHQTLELVSDIEDRIRNIFTMVQDSTKDIFNEEKDLYVCSFWFAKQLPGAFVSEHDDTDGGVNSQFQYSAVIYLNTLKDGGDLVFPDLGYSHRPVAGDIVIFRSVEGGKHFVNEISENRYTLPMTLTADKNFAI